MSNEIGRCQITRDLVKKRKSVMFNWARPPVGKLEKLAGSFMWVPHACFSENNIQISSNCISILTKNIKL